jgi:hypothetical protein
MWSAVFGGYVTKHVTNTIGSHAFGALFGGGYGMPLPRAYTWQQCARRAVQSKSAAAEWIAQSRSHSKRCAWGHSAHPAPVLRPRRGILSDSPAADAPRRGNALPVVRTRGGLCGFSSLLDRYFDFKFSVLSFGTVMLSFQNTGRSR